MGQGRIVSANVMVSMIKNYTHFIFLYYPEVKTKTEQVHLCFPYAKIWFSLTQLGGLVVEHLIPNREVLGSVPTWGAVLCS